VTELLTSPRFPAQTKALFITGTDTNVGKTHVTCLIARQVIANGVRVAAYKPVCSGAIQHDSSMGQLTPVRWDDIDRLKSAVGGTWPDEILCPQRFLAPLAPPVAARLEGKVVDFELLVKGAERFEGADLLLIEGAGRWLSPLTLSQTVADLAKALNVPVLIVARAGLGTINHTLLTIESIHARGLEVAGVVLNEADLSGTDESVQTNGMEIESRAGVPVLGIVMHGSNIELLRHERPVTIDWVALAKPFERQSDYDEIHE
jgi:dethiobiotin synthetase